MTWSIRKSVMGLAAAAGIALSASQAQAIQLEFVSEYEADGGAAEIVVYDKFTNQVFTTATNGVEVIDFADGTSLSFVRNIDLSGEFSGTGTTLDGVSSVATDPTGVGYGVATLIPDDNTGTEGRVAFYDLATGAVLGSVTVGFHPDMVTFTPDGTKILVANEGEGSGANGSISVIDVSGVASLANVSALTDGDVTTVDFTGVDLSGVRLFPDVADPLDDVEPEYITVEGSKAFVSLQEANAVAVFDLNTNTWIDVQYLGTITKLIDASDRDGPGNDGAIMIDDLVTGLPMPDTIDSFAVNGITYYVTANEGDARNQDERAGDSALLDPTYAATLDLSDDGLGRLGISEIDGDIDNDGDIDVLTAYGTRSFSIFDESGNLVFDSGSDFEVITAQFGLPFFNVDDSRSDAKGPEPEGVLVAEIAGEFFAFIALERTGGIFLYNITDPYNARFVQYIDAASFTGASERPEGLYFIDGADSPTGRSYLLVANEDSHTIDVFTTVPEPMTAGLVGMGGLLLLVRRRRAAA